MVSTTAVLVPAVFALWVVATIVVTAETWTDGTPVSDWLGDVTLFVPNWNFFAPHPGQWDYHLLYRDRLADGSVTQWTETTEVTQTRQRLKWTWNPELYKVKGLFDIGQELAKRLTDPETDAGEEDDDELAGDKRLRPVESDDHLLSTQYMLILNYVSDEAHDDDATKTQFMLMRSSLRGDDATPMFVSNFHKL